VAAEQLGNEGDTPDVGVAVFLGEAESLAQVRAHHIAVQHLHADLPLAQLPL